MEVSGQLYTSRKTVYDIHSTGGLMNLRASPEAAEKKKEYFP
jgi:hypothetical protein